MCLKCAHVGRVSTGPERIPVKDAKRWLLEVGRAAAGPGSASTFINLATAGNKLQLSSVSIIHLIVHDATN